MPPTLLAHFYGQGELYAWAFRANDHEYLKYSNVACVLTSFCPATLFRLPLPSAVDRIEYPIPLPGKQATCVSQRQPLFIERQPPSTNRQRP